MMVDRVFHGAAHLETLSRLLKWFHRDREEQFVFLVNAVLLVIHSDRVPPAPPGCTVIHSIDLVTILAAHRAAPRMELLSTVIDKHTHAGRQQGKNGFTFATEGAVVLQEDTEYLIPEWRAQYVELKRVSDQKPSRKGKRKAEEREGCLLP